MKKKICAAASLSLCLVALTGCSQEFETAMEHAALNTVLGMGMAFFMLILVSLVISLFPLISKIGQKKPEPQKEVPAAPVAEAVEEDVTDDEELVAVISAAIAAFEGGNSGYTVRSIRRVTDNRSHNNWRKF